MNAYAKRTGGVIGKLLGVALVLLILLLSFYPLLWMVLNSFRKNMEIFQNPTALPKMWDFSIFATAWKAGQFQLSMTNSLIITVGVILITQLSASLASFSFSHLKFRGNQMLLALFVGAQVVSGQIVLISIYRIMQLTNLFNTFAGLILVCTAFGMPFTVYVYSNFFRSLPHEIYESTQIDGCSNLVYFLRILLPLSAPIIASCVIFCAMGTWNEYLFSLTFLRSSELRTLTVRLRAFFSQYSKKYDVIFAGLTIAVIPIIMLYCFLQKYFIRGLTSGSVKG